jgi:hypothetical protein
MSTATTPKFLQNQALAGTLATPQVIAKGALARGTLDLTSEFGAWLMIAVGKGGTATFTAGAAVAIVPSIAQAGPSTHIHANSNLSRNQNLATVNGNTTCATSDSAAGSSTLNVASVTGFSAGDLICIQDAGGGVTRLEFARISKTATGVLTLRNNLQYTHTAAGADTVRNQADVFPRIWVPGGDIIEVVIDYGAETNADSIVAEVIVTPYTQDTSA